MRAGTEATDLLLVRFILDACTEVGQRFNLCNGVVAVCLSLAGDPALYTVLWNVEGCHDVSEMGEAEGERM